MICVSLAEPTVKDCLQALKGLEFAEIRLDKMKVTTAEVKKIFSAHHNLIATCRPGFQDREKRLELLTAAIRTGARYVDIELEADDLFKKEVIQLAQKKGCRIIVSYHNFDKTPEKPELEEIIGDCFASGGDVAKIACKVHTDKENVWLLSLLEEERPLVVFGLGNKGRLTRVIAPLLGSPFTYASRFKGKETAEGQLDLETLETLINVLKNV